MAFIKNALGGLVSGIFGGGSPQVQPQASSLSPTRNDALERAAAADSLAKRTGARKFRKTPVGGAEASTGAPTSLLGRSSGG